jgi:hypothetical protein
MLTVKTAITPSEKLAAEPVRVDEVAAEIDRAEPRDLEAQARWLELAYIFGPLGQNQHFHLRDYVEVLVAKRDGRLAEVKAAAEKLAAEKPVDEKL